MNGNKLLKKLRNLARKQGVTVTIAKHHGKDSHSTLYFADNRTTIKDRKKEIGKGLLKEALIKSNYFRLVKIVHIFPKDHSNRITIAAHFVKNTDNFSCA